MEVPCCDFVCTGDKRSLICGATSTFPCGTRYLYLQCFTQWIDKHSFDLLVASKRIEIEKGKGFTHGHNGMAGAGEASPDKEASNYWNQASAGTPFWLDDGPSASTSSVLAETNLQEAENLIAEGIGEEEHEEDDYSTVAGAVSQSRIGLAQRGLVFAFSSPAGSCRNCVF